MKELPKNYDPSEIEKPLYKTWSEKGYFKPTGDKSKAAGAGCALCPPLTQTL